LQSDNVQEHIERFREEISTFGDFPTMFMGIVKEDNGLTFYDGKVRIVDASACAISMPC
jgi:NAD-reducing hydrogenase large subunit